VANTSNPKSLERAARWKDIFDKKTKVPDEPSIPATIFINHDHVSSQRSPTALKVGVLQRIEDDDVISPERASESDLGQPGPESKRATDSPTFPI
jgi:hypothetical protein